MNKVEVNLKVIENNVKNIKKARPFFKYYMAVVKANAYGLGIDCIKYMIKGGINYLVCSTTDEAIEIRKNYPKIPILVLTPINPNEASIYLKYNLTATCDEIQTLKKIAKEKIQLHLKIDTGMNRFGFNNLTEIKKAIAIIKKSNLILEGIYSHLYYAGNKNITNHQIALFSNYIKNINYKFNIIHLFNSEALEKMDNFPLQNGVRLGAVIYGIGSKIPVTLAFNWQTTIIKIRKLKKGESLSYDGKYIALKDTLIGIIPIGYSHGLTKDNSGRYVYINDKKYYIVGNICMNLAFIEIDKSVKELDTVYLCKNINHLNDIAVFRKSVPEETMTLISEKIKRVYKK